MSAQLEFLRLAMLRHDPKRPGFALLQDQYHALTSDYERTSHDY